MSQSPSPNIDILKLNSINKLKNIIKGRIVGIIARGGSAKILEERIEEFKDYDICWASMNLFTPAENILAKIGKELDIVSDCSTVQNRDTYEPQVRMPRFKKYLEKESNNLLFISQLVIQECFKRDSNFILFKRKVDKIATIDDIFNVTEAPKAIWDAPPNSITLLLAACIAGGAKKIIMFGYDGLKGENSQERTILDKKAVNTYYREDLEKADRLIAASFTEIGSLATDSFFFERDWPQIHNIYKTTYRNNCPVLNCSPESMFTVIKKINYNKIYKELEGD